MEKEEKKFFRNVYFLNCKAATQYANGTLEFNCVLCNLEDKNKKLTYKKIFTDNSFFANIFIYAMLNDKAINILFDEDFNIHYVAYNEFKNKLKDIQANLGVVFDKKD